MSVTDEDVIELQKRTLNLANKQMRECGVVMKGAEIKLLAQKRDIERLEGALYRVRDAIYADDTRKAVGIISQALRGVLPVPSPAEAARRCHLVVDNDGSAA